MIATTDALGEMLAAITRAFLEGNEEDLRDRSFRAASRRYDAAFSALGKYLREAKFEHYVLGTERLYEIEERLADCMQMLGQSIGGLKSAAITQVIRPRP